MSTVSQVSTAQKQATVAKPRSRVARFLRRNATDYVFAAPYLLHLLIFTVFPIAFTLILSLTDWNMYRPERRFVGLDNYQALLTTDQVFIKTFGNTMYYVLFTVIGVTVLGFAMAVLLNQGLRGIRLFRTVFYFPVVVDWVIISIVWLFILEPSIGLINQFLQSQGMKPQLFFNSRAQAMPLMIMMSVWKGVAYYAIIFLAGLQDVPQVIIEQARIDGANGWQVLRHVTLPWIAPVSLFVIVIATINALRVFSQIYVITNGGPMNATITVMLYLYNNSFRYLRMGYGSAIAILFSIIVMIFVVIQRFVLSGAGRTTQ